MITPIIISLIILEGVSLPMSPVVRENYGVLFTPQGPLDNSQSTWSHTFSYNLNDSVLPEPTDSLQCDRSSDHRSALQHELNKYCPSLNVYNERIKSLYGQIVKQQSHLRQLLPVNNRTRTRTKRGLIDVVGVAAKFLFGLSTEHDTKMMQSQIAHIRADHHLEHNQIRAYTRQLRSYMIQTTERQRLLKEGIVLNRKSIDTSMALISNRVDHETNRIRASMNILHVYGVQYADTLADIRYALSQEIQATQTLLEGYLPIYFVPPDVLSKVLTAVQEKLADYKMFDFAHNGLAVYYKLRDISYQREEDFLYITLHIPITSMNTIFTVYRVQSVPIVMSETRNELSLVNFDEPYIAISSDSLFYMMMSDSEFQSCQGNTLKRCTQGLAIREFSRPNCALAMFLNDLENIQKLCDYKLIPHQATIPTKVINIEQNSYLISTTDTNWIQSCTHGMVVHVKPCRLCTITVPCRCSLRADSFYIPPTLNNCNDTRLPVSKVARNLPILFEFYGKEGDLKNLSDFVASNPDMPIDYPDITIIDNKFDNVIEQSDAIELSLKEAAVAMKANEPIYADKVSSLANDLGMLAYPAVNKGLQTLTAMSFIAAVSALVISLRNRYMLTFLTPTANAMRLPGVTTTVPPRAEFCVMGVTLSVIMVIGITIVGIIIGVIVHWLLKYRRKYRNKKGKVQAATTIKLVMFSDSDSVTVPLKTIPYMTSDLYFSTDANCIPPRLGYSSVCPYLEHSWEFAEIKLKQDGQTVKLPVSSPLSLTKLWKVRSILKSLVHLQLLAESGKEVHDIRTWTYPRVVRYKSVANNSEVSELVVETVATPSSDVNEVD